jgi:hypothetical protein
MEKSSGTRGIDKSLHIGIKSVSERGTWQLTNVKEGEQPATLFNLNIR